MSRQTAAERYHHDITYRKVVQMMENLMHEAQLTPSEIREAAVLASIHYEETTVRSCHIVLTPDLHRRLEEMHRLVAGETMQDKRQS